MRNVQYKGRIKSSPWRKISIGSWKPTGDSSIHAFEEIQMDEGIAWCENHKVKSNALLLKAIACTIAKEEQINSVVRWGRIYRRKDIKLFYHVLPNPQKDNLSGALLVNLQVKSILQVENELHEQIKAIRSEMDQFSKSRNTFRWIPGIFSRPTLNFLSFLMYTLNIRPFFVPSPKDPFGSIMVTHIGSMNLSQACTPIAPYTRIPMVIAIGKMEKRAVVVHEEVVIRQMITFGFTFDHRIMEGVHFARFVKQLRFYLENPDELEN